MSNRRSGGSTRRNKRQDYGIEVTGVTRVWANERDVYSQKKRQNFVWKEYSVSLGRKEEDGSYTNVYLPVFFNRDMTPPEESCTIEIFEGWLFVTGDSGYEKASIYVKDFEVVK